MRKKYPSEVTNILKERFPFFSKIALCYANNPLYGVDISPAAKDWLNRYYFAKFGIKREELSAEEAEAVQWYVETHFDNIKSLIIWMALQHEEPVRKGLPGPDDQVPGGL